MSCKIFYKIFYNMDVDNESRMMKIMNNKKIIQAIKYWSQVFLLPIYWLSFLIPRNKKIWVLGSSFGRRFADNPKYFFLYLSQYKKNNVRAIWITTENDIVELLKEHGLEVYKRNSWKGIWYCLRSGVYIFDNYSKDISFWLSGGAEKINLWHGVGNKKINYDNRFDTVRHPKNNWERFKTYLRRLSDEKPSHYTLATSEVMAGIFASAFRTSREHIIIEGYPRNDILISDHIKNIYSADEEKIIQEIKREKRLNKRISYYLPTFRESENKFFDVMDLENLNSFLNDNEILFFTKVHPKSKLNEKFKSIQLSNIRYLPPAADTYAILKYADLLITDYSSIYSDFLLLDRPSVLFPYDYEEYSTNTRDCYFDYDDYMKDRKAYSMIELMEAMETVLEKDICREERNKVKKWMFESCDGNACERLYNKIQSILNG